MSNADIKPKTKKIDPSRPETLIGLNPDVYIGIISQLYEQNCQLSELLQAYVQERYGQKTERFEDPQQLRLFDTKSDTEGSGAPVEAGADQEPSKPKRKGSSRERKPLASHLRRERIPSRHFTAEELVCRCCGRARIKVNEIVVHRRYCYVPASISIQEVVEEILACPDCDDMLVEANLSQTLGLAETATENSNGKIN